MALAAPRRWTTGEAPAAPRCCGTSMRSFRVTPPPSVCSSARTTGAAAVGAQLTRMLRLLGVSTCTCWDGCLLPACLLANRPSCSFARCCREGRVLNYCGVPAPAAEELAAAAARMVGRPAGAHWQLAPQLAPLALLPLGLHAWNRMIHSPCGRALCPFHLLSPQVRFFDLGGHERYSKTMLHGLTTLLPDCVLLCVSATAGAYWGGWSGFGAGSAAHCYGMQLWLYHRTSWVCRLVAKEYSSSCILTHTGLRTDGCNIPSDHVGASACP